MSLRSLYSAGDPLTPGSSNYWVVDGTEADAQVLTQAGDILRELHTLLEDYAPFWYTERHHAGIEQTLDALNLFISRSHAVSAK